MKVTLTMKIPEAENFHQRSIHEITKIVKNVKNSNSVEWDNILTNIIIIIKKDWLCKGRRGRLTPYQSEDPSPTLPTYRGKEEKVENS